jgi:hypothetical protein
MYELILAAVKNKLIFLWQLRCRHFALISQDHLLHRALSHFHVLFPPPIRNAGSSLKRACQNMTAPTVHVEKSHSKGTSNSPGRMRSQTFKEIIIWKFSKCGSLFQQLRTGKLFYLRTTLKRWRCKSWDDTFNYPEPITETISFEMTWNPDDCLGPKGKAVKRQQGSSLIVRLCSLRRLLSHPVCFDQWLPYHKLLPPWLTSLSF